MAGAVACNIASAVLDAFSLALLIDLDALARWFFDRPQDDNVSVGTAWMAVIGLLCLCWAVIGWRLRRLEVVA